MTKLYSNKLHIILFLLPALILFCGVLIAPIGAMSTPQKRISAGSRKMRMYNLLLYSLFMGRYFLFITENGLPGSLEIPGRPLNSS